MDWLSFLSSLVWPLLGLFVLIFFRKELKLWLGKRPESLKLGGGMVDIKWGEIMDDAVQTIEQAKQPETAALEPAPDSSRSPVAVKVNLRGTVPVEPLTLRLRDLANDYPDDAITHAWREVERQLQEVADEWDMTSARGKRIRPGEVVDLAERAGYLPKWFAETFTSMRNLRNLASHAGGVESVQAYEFLALADTLISELQRRFLWHQPSLPSSPPVTNGSAE
ncbi:hypothetical protein [Nocardia tengchongensis]|uniref:hypothetical protein n=1 Tax=Nocardia tengchongensis TaxID=2055889 RepID=UPI003646864F